MCSPETGKAMRSCYLYRRLRPELVKNFPTPLSSDAYSPFQQPEDREKENEDIRRATMYLEGELVPKLALRFDSFAFLYSK